MKILQKVKSQDLKNENFTWIVNTNGYVRQVVNNLANQLISEGWHRKATDSEIVKWYIKHNALTWKVNLFVPSYEVFSKNQGFTNHFESLFNGLNEFGVSASPSINQNTDGIFIFNSVWVACENGYLENMRKLADKNSIPLFMLTMFETDRFPDRFVEQLKFLDFLIVNNKDNKKTLEKQSLKIPIFVLPNPNPEGFKLLERPQKKEFVFYHYNASDRRKGFPEYLEAFLQEFKPQENVKLILKSRENDGNNKNLQDCNKAGWNEVKRKVQWIRRDMHIEDLLELHRTGDCFVFPSKGEGWGYPPIEALLTGNPVIAVPKIGMKEWFNDGCLEVKSKKEPASFHMFGEKMPDVGNWYKPNVLSLRKQMRKVYEDFKKEGRNAEIYQNAKKQSQKIAIKYEKRRVAKLFIDILAQNDIARLYD